MKVAVPVQEEQGAERSSVAGQQRANLIQHGQELHQPGHRQDGAPPLHAVMQQSAHVQHLDALQDGDRGYTNGQHPRVFSLRLQLSFTLLRKAMALSWISLDGASDVRYGRKEMNPRNFARRRARSSTDVNLCFSSCKGQMERQRCERSPPQMQPSGPVMVNLVLHVPLFPILCLLLRLPSGSRRTQDGHLVQLEELLTQAVLQVLVQLAASRKKNNLKMQSKLLAK